MKWFVYLAVAAMLSLAPWTPAQAACPGDPCIGAAKSADWTGRAVTFDIVVENLGSEPLQAVSIAEDLDAAFGAGNYNLSSAPSQVAGPNTLALNVAFDGSTDTELLEPASSTLAAGASATIRLSVELTAITDQGNGNGVYLNQVTASGEDAVSTPVSDLSDNGTDPDPNGNGDPTEAGEDDPTTVNLLSAPRIGVAKAAFLSGTTVDFLITVESFGNVSLENISIPDDLDAVFGAGNYTVTNAPALVDDPGTVTLNTGFNGSSDTELVSSGTLAIADTFSFSFSVDITNVTDVGNGLGVYSNQVDARGSDAFARFVSDLSTQGSEPDPNGNGVAGEVGENEPTPVVIGEEPAVGVAKTASVNGDLVTVDLVVENLGNITLSNLALVDDLNAAFGAGNYFLDTAPLLLVDPGTVALNAGFDGNFDIDLFDAANSSLASGATVQVRFVVDILAVADLGAGLGNYVNQAQVEGEAPGGGIAFDLSDDGTDPDPNGNGNAGDAGEDDATPITVAPRAELGIAVRPIVTVQGGLPSVQQVFTLTNYGNQALSSISISNNLNSVYGAGNFSHLQDPVLVGGSPTLNYNASFNGNTNTAMLNAGSTLPPGESVTFRIESRINIITDQGFGLGIYEVQVTANALDPSANPVSDVSTSGADPDTNGDGNPDEMVPTPIDVNAQRVIGLAKDVSVVGSQVTFDIYLENLGTTTIQSIDVRDQLESVFGAGNYVVSSAPALVVDPGTLSLDPSYDGSQENADLFLPLSSELAAGAIAQVRFVVDVTQVSNVQNLGLGNYSAQATLTALTDQGAVITDTSDFGTDPDPNGNGEPNEAGENDATTFSLGVDTPVGVAKTAAVVDNVVTFDLYIEAFGAGTLSNLSLVDDLDATFGAGSYSFTQMPNFIVDPGTITLNGSFDGGANPELLNTLVSTLAAGATAQIQFAVSVDTESDQGAGFGIYNNQAVVSGEQTNGLVVSDRSDDGTDPDPNANGDPGEAGEEDATPIVIVRSPALGVALQGTVSGTNVIYDYYVENLGNSTLTNFLIQAPLNPVFGSGNYSIAQQPTLVNGPATLSLSPQYFGFNIFDRVVVSGSLRPGELAHFRTIISVNTVSDQGNGFGIYNLQVNATATDPAGNSFADLSDAGTVPDPNNNGAAGDAGEDDVTQVAIGDEANIGLAKDVSVSGNQVTIDFYLENFGGSTLSSLSLIDDLDAVFGNSNYSVSSVTLVDDPGTINLNGGFDGAGTTEVLAGGSTLNALDTAQVRLEVDVTNVTDQGNGLGAFTNQASVSGTAPLGATTSDLSDAGTDPDPSGNGFGNDAGESDRSTFTVGFTRVGAAKNATVNGNVVTFDYYVENLGSTAFSSVSLTDDFDAVFGAGNYTLLSPPEIVSAPRTLVVNPNFDGSSDTQLIASGGLSVGGPEQIQVAVEVDRLIDTGSGLGVYTNQVTVNADASSDVSDAGTSADTDGDGDANGPGENDPTVFTVGQDAIIGAAKQVSVSNRLVTVDVQLAQLGNVDASDISVVDNLDAVFGAGNYTVTQTPIRVSGPATVVTNGSFDGSAQDDLLSAGSTMALGETAELRFVVRVDNVVDQGFGLGEYSNQATVGAAAPDSSIATDLSDDGAIVDANGNGNPDEAGENDASPFVLEATISGVVYNDTDGDGVATGEPGLDAVTVYLDLNSNASLDGGEPSTVTSAAGAYSFDRLAAGNYTVQVDESTLPADFVLTGGSNPTALAVFAGEQASVDVGYQQQNASVGDLVFNDLNGNGALDAGESGLTGVVVYLDANTNGTRDGGEAFATTDANGNYLIGSLPTGTYAVAIDAASVPANFVLTAGTDPTVVTLAAGEANTNADFGFQQQDATIGDLVWQDDNGNGVLDGGEAGIAGATVFIDDNGNGLLDVGETSVVTDAAGAYDFTNLATGSYDVAVDLASVAVNLALTNTTQPIVVNLATSEDFNDADFGFEVQPEPGFGKVFASPSVVVGEPVTLTFTIDNSANLVDADDLDFVDNFPADMAVAALPQASTSCLGGTLTAVAGAASISYTGGSVAAGDVCAVSVDVVVASEGTFVNVSGDLTSTLGNSGPASDSVLGFIPPVPLFSKAFASAAVVTDTPVGLSIIIDNSAATVPANNLSFADPLPAGMVVANPASASTSCTGGTLSATAGGNTISYSGGSVAAGSVCSVDVDVVVASEGLYTNITGDLTSSLGNSGPATDTLDVRAISVTLEKTFLGDNVLPGETIGLQYVITNTSTQFPATAIGFSDNLGAALPGLQRVSTDVVNNCGPGNISGSDPVVVSDVSLGIGEVCVIEITLQVPVFAAGGRYTIDSSPLQATLDGVSITGNSASGSFTVNGTLVAIPTLNHWMLLLLMMAMSAVAMVRMRH
jgi:hypothetical protein